MEQQDIVWVEVTYSNLEEGKIRPALIVSNNDYNLKNRDVIVCAITSNLEERPYSISISQSNLSHGALPIKSKIKADKIMQIEKKKIARVFARLNDNTFDQVVKKLVTLLSKK